MRREGTGTSTLAGHHQERAGGHRRTQGLLLTVWKSRGSGQRNPIPERTAHSVQQEQGYLVEMEWPQLPELRPTHSLGWEPGRRLSWGPDLRAWAGQ